MPAKISINLNAYQIYKKYNKETQKKGDQTHT